jgi:hypothetical protein
MSGIYSIYAVNSVWWAVEVQVGCWNSGISVTEGQLDRCYGVSGVGCGGMLRWV